MYLSPLKQYFSYILVVRLIDEEGASMAEWFRLVYGFQMLTEGQCFHQ